MKIKKSIIRLAVIIPLLSFYFAAGAQTLRGDDNFNGCAALHSLSFDNLGNNISFSKTRYAGYDEFNYPDYDEEEFDEDEDSDRDRYLDRDYEPPVGARGR